MNGYEQTKVLASLEIIVDTREKKTEQAKKRFESFNCPYRVHTLAWGDYTFNATLLNGNKIYDVSQTVRPVCAIERKMSMDELAQCFCNKNRQRFEAELQRATLENAKIILIVENGSWEAILNKKYRTEMHPRMLLASVTAFMVRYNMQLIFCKEENSGLLIKEILFRELKERLERGEYDE